MSPFYFDEDKSMFLLVFNIDSSYKALTVFM